MFSLAMMQALRVINFIIHLQASLLLVEMLSSIREKCGDWNIQNGENYDFFLMFQEEEQLTNKAPQDHATHPSSPTSQQKSSSLEASSNQKTPRYKNLSKYIKRLSHWITLIYFVFLLIMNL